MQYRILNTEQAQRICCLVFVGLLNPPDTVQLTLSTRTGQLLYFPIHGKRVALRRCQYHAAHPYPPGHISSMHYTLFDKTS